MSGSRLQAKLLRRIGRLNKAFGLIEPDDRIMVAISGGKDSWSLLDLLRAYERVVPFSFEVVAVNLDQGQPGFEQQRIVDYLRQHGYAHEMVFQDTYRVVVSETKQGKAYCSLCSRLRRGILYDLAAKLGASKIALGHHRDDVIETALLNAFYAGQLKAMPPKLNSDDGRNVIIRPLAYCAEADLAAYAAEREFPILPCDLCGSQEALKRKRIKGLLAELELENPEVRSHLMAALGNVKPTHLYDQRLQSAPEGAGVDVRRLLRLV
jgi:tRNA 2-thiocytidine biosynthesis protein TtcA